MFHWRVPTTVVRRNLKPAASFGNGQEKAEGMDGKVLCITV